MIFLDTNIFLRYFEQSDRQKAKKIERLFERLLDADLKCFTNSMVIVEIIWVLEKYYGWAKGQVCENIELILNTPNILIAERSILRRAISIYKNTDADFIDLYNYEYIKHCASSEIYSYDKHYDELNGTFGDIKRLLP